MPFPIEQAALDHLSQVDPIMARLINYSDRPQEPTINDPFLALVDTVIGQQISEHVKAILMQRLEKAAGGLSKASIKALGKKEIHHLGVSKMKADTLLRLAEMENTLDTLKNKDKKTIEGALKSIKGIGPWTIDMFFFICLQDPNILSLKDMGIRNAIKRLYGVEDDDLETFKAYFHPYESVASAYLWKSLEYDSDTIQAIKKGVFINEHS